MDVAQFVYPSSVDGHLLASIFLAIRSNASGDLCTRMQGLFFF